MSLNVLNVLLTPISLPIARFLDIPRLPSHFSTVVFSFLTFHLIQWTSPIFFNRWFPEHYGKASKRVKQGWAVRACSMFHAVAVVILALRCLVLPELNDDKLWGSHPLEGEMEAFACGLTLARCSYFLWDAMEEGLIHYQDIGFALHGVLVLIGVLLTFRPLFAYTSVRFLLMELSTPFLNIHWYLDKTGRTGSIFQFINGIALLVVFFLARICYGSIATYTLLSTLYEARAVVPPFISAMYTVGTVALQILNWTWMYKMVSALRKRFPSESSKAKTQ